MRLKRFLQATQILITILTWVGIITIFVLLPAKVHGQLPPGHPVTYPQSTMESDLTPGEQFWYTAGLTSGIIYLSSIADLSDFKLHLKTIAAGAKLGKIDYVYAMVKATIRSDFGYYSQASWVAVFCHILALSYDRTYGQYGWPNAVWPDLENLRQYNGKAIQ